MRALPPIRARRAGFTLLEIMAVVAIFALVASITLPNFSRLQTRRLDSVAKHLVAQVEFARQRAIVTGVPHRLTIDIDGGGYRIEWLGRAETEEFAPEPTDDYESTYADTGESLDLSAPITEDREFEPVSGRTGRTSWLDDSLLFAGVETTGGWVDEGESFIRFEQDGSADPTTIVVEHEVGHTVTLEIRPLASTVRVTRETI